MRGAGRGEGKGGGGGGTEGLRNISIVAVPMETDVISMHE